VLAVLEQLPQMMLVLLALTRYFQALLQLEDRLGDIRAFPVALAQVGHN
jgi:hypothetical protein